MLFLLLNPILPHSSYPSINQFNIFNQQLVSSLYLVVLLQESQAFWRHSREEQKLLSPVLCITSDLFLVSFLILCCLLKLWRLAIEDVRG